MGQSGWTGRLDSACACYTEQLQAGIELLPFLLISKGTYPPLFNTVYYIL